jgi:hypothetical protein
LESSLNSTSAHQSSTIGKSPVSPTLDGALGIHPAIETRELAEWRQIPLHFISANQADEL